jgi:hypothetical protein
VCRTWLHDITYGSHDDVAYTFWIAVVRVVTPCSHVGWFPTFRRNISPPSSRWTTIHILIAVKTSNLISTRQVAVRISVGRYSYFRNFEVPLDQGYVTIFIPGTEGIFRCDRGKDGLHHCALFRKSP